MENWMQSKSDAQLSAGLQQMADIQKQHMAELPKTFMPPPALADRKQPKKSKGPHGGGGAGAVPLTNEGDKGGKTNAEHGKDGEKTAEHGKDGEKNAEHGKDGEKSAKHGKDKDGEKKTDTGGEESSESVDSEVAAALALQQARMA